MIQHHSNQDMNRRDLFKVTGAAGLGIGAVALSATVATPAIAAGTGFAHPGLLHSQADLDRMAAKVKTGAQPYLAGWHKLLANPHSQDTWKPNPLAVVYRGQTQHPQNYSTLYNDIHAAYQNALRWHISGRTTHADTARDILNAWSTTLTNIDGSAGRFIAAGILERLKTMLLNVIYPMN
ncbi:hypothetical protein ACWD25_22295 [Streptomyces sp. NPDC002920]